MRLNILFFASAFLLTTHTVWAAGARPLPSFTAAQARQGEEIYESTCAMCHGSKLEGNFDTPSLTGRFIQNWKDTPIMELYAYIHRAMPQMSPGALSPEDTTAVIAYILEQNSIQAGKTPLSTQPKSLRLQFIPHVITNNK